MLWWCSLVCFKHFIMMAIKLKIKIQALSCLLFLSHFILPGTLTFTLDLILFKTKAVIYHNIYLLFQRCHSQSWCWRPRGAGQRWQDWTPVRNMPSKSLCSTGQQRNFWQRDDSPVRNTDLLRFYKKRVQRGWREVDGHKRNKWPASAYWDQVCRKENVSLR